MSMYSEHIVLSLYDMYSEHIVYTLSESHTSEALAQPLLPKNNVGGGWKARKTLTEGSEQH
jgi:hypothetical protein